LVKEKVMRRTWLLASAALAAGAAVALLSLPPRSGARAAARGGEGEPEAAKAVALPLGQVVLYSSGVGYFQREGTVEGAARVDLAFPSSDINDLLKSMVLRDLDGGAIAAVSYDANAPIERTLQSFALNLTGHPSLAQLLEQARGEKVEVALLNAAAGAPATLSGTIVGLEKQKQAAGQTQVEVSVLNLWCADGLRALKLAEVQRLRFLNPVLEGEFKKALETLAQGHDTQKKAVSIRFAGEGKRRVRVGYVVENPIWKTSYRLVLSAKKAEAPYLQGWAVVDNASDEDWQGVRMALISGRPISFKMDLYTPLYVPRPTVVPDLFASLNPVAYSGSMESEGRRMAQLRARHALGGEMFYERGARKEEAKAAEKRMSDSAAHARYAGAIRRDLAERLDLGRSVASAASAGQLGDYFQYALDKPVSLARQKSALLPIVAKDVQAQRVSIYNEGTQAKFPLLGLRLKNTSGLHLMQGPITVFEGATYAGDARIMDLQPGESRLLSYAVDLGTEVSPKPTPDSGRLVALKAVKGLLWTTTKRRLGRTYTVKNRNEQKRTVLVEHPVQHPFQLVDTPKPAETASDVYRFEVQVSPGESKSLTVTQERDEVSSVQLSNTADEQIRFFLRQPTISARVKAGLNRALQLRLAVSKTRSEMAEQQRQLNTLTTDQGRLRANLREMPATAKAYKRYLEKFDLQETQIEQYQAEIKKLQGEEHRQQKDLDSFLASFSAD
jgi:hypothetical protein